MKNQNWKYLKIGEPIKIWRNDAKFKTIKKLTEKLLTERKEKRNVGYTVIKGTQEKEKI